MTWALRTCRATRGPADVRYGPTFPRKLHLILTNQGTENFSRCLGKIRTLLDFTVLVVLAVAEIVAIFVAFVAGYLATAAHSAETAG